MASLTLVALQAQRIEPIDLNIEAGALAFLSGPSGAGKSLLLRAIADLDPSQGEVLLDGQPRSSIAAPDWRRRVGLLPAESGWWADKVGDHFPTETATDPQQQAWLERVELGTDVLDWEVQRLSTGERQRLGLVRMLCYAPEVLLLDEATANLDPTNRERCEQLIEAYRRDRQAAVFWASHDPEQRQRLAEATGGQRFLISAGRLCPEPSASPVMKLNQWN